MTGMAGEIMIRRAKAGREILFRIFEKRWVVIRRRARHMSLVAQSREGLTIPSPICSDVGGNWRKRIQRIWVIRAKPAKNQMMKREGKRGIIAGFILRYHINKHEGDARMLKLAEKVAD